MLYGAQENTAAFEIMKWIEAGSRWESGQRMGEVSSSKREARTRDRVILLLDNLQELEWGKENPQNEMCRKPVAIKLKSET